MSTEHGEMTKEVVDDLVRKALAEKLGTDAGGMSLQLIMCGLTASAQRSIAEALRKAKPPKLGVERAAWWDTVRQVAGAVCIIPVVLGGMSYSDFYNIAGAD